MADTLGSLLTCYWCIKSAELPEMDDMSTLVEYRELQAHVEAFGESDEFRCLDVLLYSNVRVLVVEEHWEVARTMNVGEAIRQYCADPDVQTQTRLGIALQNYGVRVRDDDGVWKTAVPCSASYKALQAMFARTAWKNGNWSLLLCRLPGGTGDTQRIAGRTCKVSMFNVPEDLLGLTGARSAGTGARAGQVVERLAA